MCLFKTENKGKLNFITNYLLIKLHYNFAPVLFNHFLEDFL